MRWTPEFSGVISGSSWSQSNATQAKYPRFLDRVPVAVLAGVARSPPAWSPTCSRIVDERAKMSEVTLSGNRVYRAPSRRRPDRARGWPSPRPGSPTVVASAPPRCTPRRCAARAGTSAPSSSAPASRSGVIRMRGVGAGHHRTGGEDRAGRRQGGARSDGKGRVLVGRAGRRVGRGARRRRGRGRGGRSRLGGRESAPASTLRRPRKPRRPRAGHAWAWRRHRSSG